MTKLQRGAKIAVTMSTAGGASKIRPACHGTVNAGGFSMISTQPAFGSKMNSAHIRKVIAAGMIGNALEWYDFAIYGYFAVQIGHHFFPHGDAVAQL